jgi:hypothetical protein
LDQLGTAATNRSIVPAPGDYDDGDIGGIFGKGTRFVHHKPHMLPRREPGLPRWEARHN